jgi:hypothetical protein
LFATLLCAAGVPLLVLLLVRWLFGVPLSAFRPVLSDEIYCWHESLTFARAGLHGGYYTVQEVTNSSGVTPFGAHGAGFVMLYGLAASVFEWHRHKRAGDESRRHRLCVLDGRSSALPLSPTGRLGIHTFPPATHVQPLATFPYGTLYLNLESGCDPQLVNRSTEGRSDPTASRSNRDEPTREATPR